MDSELGRRLSATEAARRARIEVPSELDRAWAWMESRGFAREERGLWVVAPYAGERSLGVWFSDADTEHPLAWFDPAVAQEAAARLLVIGGLAGDGTVAALWRTDEGRVALVGLGSEGEAFTLAETTVDFLRLCAIGYDEIVPAHLDGPPGEPADADDAYDATESIAAVADFRAWVEETFEVTVPEFWELPDEDPFAVWVAGLTSESARALDAAPDALPPDRLPAGTPPFGGDVAALMGALGKLETSDEALLVAELVGLARPARLSDVKAELDERGLWVTVEDGTVWRLVAQIDSDHRPYQRRAELLPPLTWTELPDDVEAVLGDPLERYDEGRRPGQYALRQWLTPQGYVCLSWNKRKVWGLTVGVEPVELPG